MDDFTDKVIKGYELRARIGAGGFGAVYRAYQPIVARDVAIKIVLPQYANHPDFIRRFEAEALLVARLEHAHIVPLYDYWREPGGAYLVMRWLRGGSLRAALRRGLPPLESVARQLEQITAALAMAHRQGVVHRDVKPDNILLDEEGDAYLADFGIAKDLVRDATLSITGQLVGSPAYLSPEQVKGDPATPHSDIYSLGITLYEWLTGQTPFSTTLSLFDVMQKHLSEPVPSLQERRPDLPRVLDEIIQKATAKDPAHRFPDARSVALVFRQAITPGQTFESPTRPEQPEKPMVTPGAIPAVPEDEATFTPGNIAEALGATRWHDEGTVAGIHTPDLRNPYKGLRAFQEPDAADFFGRDGLTRRLVERLAEPETAARFLAVVGPSGSGKSSVVKAGLIPALRRGAFPGSKDWFVVEMTPGARPFDELADALLRVAITPADGLQNQLQKDERGLQRAVGRILPDDEQIELLLVIDQFEELFTAVEDETARSRFLDSLFAAVTAPQSRLRVIITLRADFYDRPLLYAQFGNLVRQRTEVVLPLAPDELERVIVGPAEQVGARLEDGLLEAIVTEVGQQPGALPLLQYALTELFERREGQVLTLAAYRASGGVLGVLARRAEELYAGLDETEQQAARQLFLRLVTPGEGTEDTRRRARRAEMTMTATSPVMDKVIDAFGRYRLLTFDRDPQTREPTVEVAHEALIRTWERLRGWLAESREDVRLQRLLGAAAVEWLRAGRDTSFLATGTRLDQFVEWSRTTTLALNQEEQEFLAASLAERQALQAADEARKAREAMIARRAQNFGRAAAILAVVGVLAVLAMIAAAWRAASASNQVAVAGQTLTPVGPTLTAVGQELQAGNNRLATATLAQGQALQQAAAAQTQVAAAGQTLTPIGVTLTAVGQELRAGNNRLATATLVQGRALEQAAAAQTQVGHVGQTLTPARVQLDRANDLVATAQTQVAIAGQTLTPVGPTLTAVRQELQTGNNRLATATIAQGQALQQAAAAQTQVGHVGQTLTPARVQLDQANSQINTAQARVAAAEQTLAPIPPTMTAVAQKIAAGEKQVEALRLVTAANTLLQTEGGDTETAALLSIRALKMAYSPQADAALQQALSQRNTLYNLPGAGQEVVFAPDGKTFATGGPGRVQLWDAASGKLLRRFDDTGPHVGFISDGKTLFTADTHGSVKLWNVDSGQLVRAYGIGASSQSLALSPGGYSFATSGSGISSSLIPLVKLWSTLTGELLQDLTPADCCFTSAYSVRATFSPDGKTVFAVGGGTRAWNTSNGQFAYQLLLGPNDDPASAAYSPDGKLLVVGHQRGVVSIWDAVLHGKEASRTIAAHTGSVLHIAFSADGHTFLTASADHTLKLWDTATGRLLRTFSGHADSVIDAAFSPDGRFILSAGQDGSVRLWTLTGEGLMRSLVGNDTPVRKVVWSPDGETILTSNANKTVNLWDVVGKQRKRSFKFDLAVEDVAFAADSNTFLVVSGPLGAGGNAWVIDLASGRNKQSFDQNFVCQGQQMGGFVLGDISPNGKLALLAGYGDTCLLDVETGALLARFAGGQAATAFSRDGTRFLICSAEHRSCNVQDIVNGKPTQAHYFFPSTSLTAGALSPDGKTALVAGGDNSISLWDITRGRVIQTYSGHTGKVTGLAFSPDGKTFVSGSLDRTVRLWDISSGQLLRTLTGHMDTVTSVAFSPDGKLVVSGSDDKTVRFWDASYQGWIDYACSRVFRDLTADERAQYGITDNEATCPPFAPPAPPAAAPAPTRTSSP